jgi:hypothetical protein
MVSARLDLLDLVGLEPLGEERMAKAKAPACDNCYFGKNMLCALNLGRPCPTYRPADRGLKPERQLAFVFRAERTRAVYAFPQPQ